jgi:hypothetical protein
MTLRPLCGAAPLAQVVGGTDVHGREAVPVPAVAAARSLVMQPSREVRSTAPISQRAAAPALDGAAARPQRRDADDAAEAPGEQVAPGRVLALLSALGAMVLLVSRHLRREP